MLSPYARDSLSIELQLDGDWSAWTFKGEIRTQRSHTSQLIETFTPDVSDAATGLITFSLTAAEMQALAPGVEWWFDLRAVNGAAQITFVQDQISLTANVTA